MNNIISSNLNLQFNLPSLHPSQDKTQQTLLLQDSNFSENKSGIKVSISSEGIAQYLSSTSSVMASENLDKDVSKTLQMGKVSSDHFLDVISKGDALNLFTAVMNIGETITSRGYYFFNKIGAENSQYFSQAVSALAMAGESAGEMMDLLPKMEVEERQLFLSIASQQSKNVVPGLVKIASLIGNSSLHIDFLNIAKDLSDDELADFIKAAVENPEDIAGLIQEIKKLGDVDRTNFLTASADSPDLMLLISHVKKLDDTALSDFLFSAARAGKAQGKLIALSNQLTETEMEQDVLSMASTLSGREFENYLHTVLNAGSERSELHKLIQSLEGNTRQLFLEAGAKAGSETKALIHQVSRIGKNSASLDGFLSAANRSKDISGLISIAGASGDKHFAFFSLVGELHTADLENFIVAAKGLEAEALGQFIELGDSLAGIEKSHFFFGALKTGHKFDQFIRLVKNTGGQEREDFLLVMANGEDEEVPYMIGRVGSMASNKQRMEFLVNEKQVLLGTEQRNLSSIYVHLSNHFDTNEFHDFLSAADSISSESDVDRLLKVSDSVADRASFLATAAGAKKELPSFLDLSERLSGAQKEKLLAFAGKLQGKNLQNFLDVADRSQKNLDEFILLTNSLSGQKRRNFLKASVDASQQGVLDEYLDLSSQLTGLSQGMFLSVAQNAGLQLVDLIESTQNFISSERSSFMAAAEMNGFRLRSLFEEDSVFTYTLRECCKEDISQFISAARATGFNPDLIFSQDQSGYRFKNEQNSEYIQQYIKAIEKEGFDLEGNSYLRNKETGFKLAGTSSGGIYKFLENAMASKNLLGAYLKPYLS